MKKIFLDIISSVTKNVPLTQKTAIIDTIPAREGTILAAQVLDNKKIYNKVELRNGRFSILKKGDVIAVALGNRRALKGFVGEVPKKIAVNDVINLLNLGGVAGVCTSASTHEVGKPLRLKILGALCDESGTVFSVKDYTHFKPAARLTNKIPLIVISGTCMNVGKTSVATEIIKHAAHSGYNIAAAKVAGIAALKDTETMEDFGATNVTSFLDGGYPSTVHLNGELRKLTYGALNYLAAGTPKPDAIVIEFGDGILGEYGVESLLSDPQLQKNIMVHIGCAYDPVGAIKLAEICKKLKAPLTLISGPVTDNAVGTAFITQTVKLPAFNALYSGKLLFDFINEKWLKKMKRSSST